MGDPKGFLKVSREAGQCRPVCERVTDFRDVSKPRPDKISRDQSSRCMDCGTPFCHWGCPVANLIPEWNDLVFHGHWEKAVNLLRSTNNLPEVTGRICPATCEYACVLGINDDPVTIRENELSIIEYAFKHSLMKPRTPKTRTGFRVAIVGSGPAGIACADQLNKAGHMVTVFEKDDSIGGIMRYGIPDFKLEKHILDRRIGLLKNEGITFKTGVNVGQDMKTRDLLDGFDAVCLTGGSRVPRDLKIDGRELNGIYFAMDYLIQSNKKSAGRLKPDNPEISANGKRVVVIGGGDTGSDCVGTAHRQGASCVVQIEVLPKPPDCRPESMPWPKYPLILKTSTSHEEGGERHWSILTKRFVGESGSVKKISCVRVEFSKDARGCPVTKEIPGSEFDLDADLVVLAIGFLHPEHAGPVKDLGLVLDEKGNVKTGQDYMTSVKNVFSAGDMRRGQSLIVWAISEGRRAAHFIDKHLTGKTSLPLI